MHLAETKEQARKDVEYGIVPFSRYFTHVLPAGPVRGDTAEEIIANVDEDGFAVIGTPDDAIRKIQELVDQSGGFGTFLLFGHEWASPAATKHSFELFAQYVMPHFRGQLDAPAQSCEWVTGSGGEFVNRAANAIMQAIADHAADKQDTSTSGA
jgi:limonene 1,2-monooxygenase